MFEYIFEYENKVTGLFETVTVYADDLNAAVELAIKRTFHISESGCDLLTSDDPEERVRDINEEPPRPYDL